MNNKLKRLAEPNVRMHFFFLVLFAVATFFLGDYIGTLELAAIEGGIVLLLAVYSVIMSRRKRRQLSAYIESVMYETENAKSNTLMNFPLPIAVFRLEDSGIIWGNDMFFGMCGSSGDRLDARLTDLVPEFSGKWLLEGKSKYNSLIEINDRKYQIHGNIIRTAEEKADSTFMGITYWVDVTEYEEIRREYEESRPVVGVIVIDNLEELYRNQPERVRNDIRDSIEDKLNQWGSERNAVIRRFERDRYIVAFEERYLQALKDTQFEIVEQVHEVESPTGIPASISIGLGEDSDTISEAFQAGAGAVELALSRGGDQTVIKNKYGYEFFGGRGNEIETRNNVKSRVMANALSEMIRDSSQVFVMGHKYADLDAIGSATGVVCLSRKLGVSVRIVVDRNNTASAELIKRLKSEEEYRNLFITPQEALIHSDSGTLLVVVDTNRPEQVENRDVLLACNRVVVIDHHRVGATCIDSSALSLIEPYASSVSELMTELLQEIVDKQDVLKCEAEAMLAGMVLDTKNFTVRTGERTFEAAAYLRRAGADTSEVKKLLQSDMETTVARYNVLRSAELYKNIAIAAPSKKQSRIVAAQAADELLNISGVEASIVMAPDGNGGAFISARSIGDVNVQILMEQLGGGGNRSVAAAQFAEIDIDTLYSKVISAIDEYYETE